MLAFVYNDISGEMVSAFPTTNPITTCEVAGQCPEWHDVYRWASLGRTVIPNAGQPQGHHARVTLFSPQGLQPGWGPGETLQYKAIVHNLDNVPLANAALILAGTPGLLFDSLDKESDVRAESDRWFVQVGDLNPGETLTFTLTTHLAADLTAIHWVTLTASLDMPLPASEPMLATDVFTHQVDSEAPIVQIDVPANTLPPGVQVVHGTADDGNGGGIDYVEVRVNDGPWMMAEGKHAWQAAMEIPTSGPVELAARATDEHGYQSAVVLQPILVDGTPPTADLMLAQTTLAGRVARLAGFADDLDGSGVAGVQIQIDDGHWVSTKLPLQPVDGERVQWQYVWTLPREDGVAHTIAVRASDWAGNIGPASAPVPVTVDSIAPVSTIVAPQPGDVVTGLQISVSGVAADGNGISMVEVSIDGGQSWMAAELEPGEGAGFSLRQSRGLAAYATHP